MSKVICGDIHTLHAVTTMRDANIPDYLGELPLTLSKMHTSLDRNRPKRWIPKYPSQLHSRSSTYSNHLEETLNIWFFSTPEARVGL